MEASRPGPAEMNLPDPEVPDALPEPLVDGQILEIPEAPQADDSKVSRIGSLLKPLVNRRPEAPEAPATPPPFDVENMVYQRVPDTEHPTKGEELVIPHTVEAEVPPAAAPEKSSQQREEAAEHLKEVVDAIIENEPIEATFEERHETVGESRPLVNPNATTPLKNVVEEIRRQTEVAHAAFNRMTDHATSGTRGPRVFRQQPPLYRKAIVGGLAGAGVILVGVVVWSLLK